jgi:hypothetical protein
VEVQNDRCQRVWRMNFYNKKLQTLVAGKKKKKKKKKRNFVFFFCRFFWNMFPGRLLCALALATTLAACVRIRTEVENHRDADLFSELSELSEISELSEQSSVEAVKLTFYIFYFD